MDGDGAANASLPYAVAALQGPRRAMHDAVAVVMRFLAVGTHLFHFFGVFDGHGGSGAVARACTERIPTVLAEEAVATPVPAEEDVVGWRYWWTGVLTRGFRRVDEEVVVAEEAAGPAMWWVGSTAVVAVVGPRTLVVANCGHSRAVLYRGGEAFPLSLEHRPNRDDEHRRIVNAGGLIVDWHGLRVLGVHAATRSIGDYYLKHYVIADPDVIVVERREEDEFLVLASDGLWNVMPSKLGGDLVRYCLSGGAARDNPQLAGKQETEVAAQLLATGAIHLGSRDNVSVVVVSLKRMGGRPPAI